MKNVKPNFLDRALCKLEDDIARWRKAMLNYHEFAFDMNGDPTDDFALFAEYRGRFEGACEVLNEILSEQEG